MIDFMVIYCVINGYIDYRPKGSYNPSLGSTAVLKCIIQLTSDVCVCCVYDCFIRK